MKTVFKLAYGLVVAILFVLFVILGTRTFYDEPEPPVNPTLLPPVMEETARGREPVAVELIYCERDGRCFKGGQELTAEEETRLTDEEKRYLQEQRDFQEQRRDYEDERADYHRNVFLLASVLGVAAAVGGVALFRRVEAMPLGLLLGGLGVVIFGWVQAAEDFGEIGMAPLFAVVAAGLAVMLAVGYRFLGPSDGPARPATGREGDE